VLRLLPHETARHLLNEPGLIIRRSPQHADYVLSTLAWSRMEGGHFKNKRNEIAKLEREHHPEIREIVLSDPDIQQEMTDLFGRWVIERNRAGRQDTVIESLALRRVFSLDRPQDLLAFGLYVDGQMIAYSINERLNGEYAMGHHWKSAGHYPGAYPLMLRHTCRTLAAEGRRFLNIQQDLGEPGLQRSKQLYRPERYLHKYELEAETDPRELSGIPLRIFISAPQPAPLELGWMDSSHVG
jgi:hypothetical protein